MFVSLQPAFGKRGSSEGYFLKKANFFEVFFQYVWKYEQRSYLCIRFWKKGHLNAGFAY